MQMCVPNRESGTMAGNNTINRLEESNMGFEVSGLFGLLLLIADVYAVVKTVQSNATTGSKVLWIVVVLLLPLVGLIAWFLFGPKGR